ncbi:DNA polymerase III subunit beta [Oceanirhabdus seepicola]|uniref:Beta sliding clamp n=1 Tax=Oceanirhabdus seepicola TaxID=2828781 RepID=A0A9J6NYT1_9CLOT|nr:DNA polymerase III subunit beta [Oceanirhabdus seepicola]MCM1989134.1 DNA polymerase III subunit beta [Oceanirhabdus seepicola]
MKFIIHKSELLNGVSIAQKAISNKSLSPLLQGLHIKTNGDSIEVTGSSNDVIIHTKLEGKVISEGEVIVSSRMFGDIIRRLPNEEITIERNESTLIIYYADSKAQLNCNDGDDYPRINNQDLEHSFYISTEELKKMIDGCVYACSSNDVRNSFTGVLFDIQKHSVAMVAMDGLRVALSKRSYASSFTGNRIIPGSTLADVSRIITNEGSTVNVSFNDNNIIFITPKTMIYSRIIQGEFINYEAVIPDSFNISFNIPKDKLLPCIDRAALFGKESSGSLVLLEISENNLTISANSQYGLVDEHIKMAPIIEGDLKIGFNSRYLLDALKNIDSDEINMSFNSEITPTVIKKVDSDESLAMLMPVRHRS